MTDRPTCFVVQGFGVKTDFQSGRTLDLDASYLVIKEAVQEAGFDCFRADEIPGGHIERTMYDQLLNADLVVADLSTLNPNVFYELGVRFALRPRATIVVAEDGINFPFDVSHVPIYTYTHLGEDIGLRESRRFKDELKRVIEAAGARPDDSDSPVYQFLNYIHPQPTTRTASADDRTSDGRPASPSAPGDKGPEESLSTLKVRAKVLMDTGDFDEAARTWREVRERGPKDDHVVQQLASAVMLGERPSRAEAAEAARGIAEYLQPERSLDPSTLQLWMSVQKRLYEATGDLEVLSEVIQFAERSLLLTGDHFSALTLALMLRTRSSREEIEPDQAEEDRFRARGIYRRLISDCESQLDGVSSDKKFWTLATLWAAAEGLGDAEAASRWRTTLDSLEAPAWMRGSAARYVDELRTVS